MKKSKLLLVGLIGLLLVVALFLAGCGKKCECQKRDYSTQTLLHSAFYKNCSQSGGGITGCGNFMYDSDRKEIVRESSSKCNCYLDRPMEALPMER